MNAQSKAPSVLTARVGSDENANHEDGKGAFALDNYVLAACHLARDFVVECGRVSALCVLHLTRLGTLNAQPAPHWDVRQRQLDERQVAA
jgi:hypothetical protein